MLTQVGTVLRPHFVGEGVVGILFELSLAAQLEVAVAVLGIVISTLQAGLRNRLSVFSRLLFKDSLTTSPSARNQTIDWCGPPHFPTVASVANSAVSRSRNESGMFSIHLL